MVDLSPVPVPVAKSNGFCLVSYRRAAVPPERETADFVSKKQKNIFRIDLSDKYSIITIREYTMKTKVALKCSGLLLW
jgi:hypothetical protein